MEKIALITDSTSDINKDLIKQYNIKVLPLRICFNNKEYIDGVNITSEGIYEKMKTETATTSLVSMEDVEKIYAELESEGYTHAIIIPLSSGLSGSYNMLKLNVEENKKIKTHVYDGKFISMGTGALILKCAKLIEEGKNFDYIISALPSMKEKINLFFIVDTLEYLIKGGRIGKVKGTLGQLLKIKPIISVDDEGKYFTYKNARGKNQAFKKIVDMSSEILEHKKCNIYIMHGAAEQEAIELYNMVKELKNIKNIEIGEISPGESVHAGPGLLGIVLVED